VQQYVRTWAKEFLEDPRATDLIEGNIARGPLQDERVDRVLERLRELARALA
jgi:hypothetical protein